MSRMDVDEEDPVVRELPVYLSLELTHQLYLLQYPLRAAGRPYDQGGVTPVSCAFYLDASGARCQGFVLHHTFVVARWHAENACWAGGPPIAGNSECGGLARNGAPLVLLATLEILLRVETARVKPVQQKIELNFPIKTNGENYDRARGEQIAEYTIERPDDDIGAAVADVTSQMFPSGTMDSFTLRSSRLPFKAHYMVGMVADDKLHLSPLHGVSQLRPALTHLEEADRIKQAAGKPKGAKADGGTEENRPYSTTFKRRETERAIAARMRSHSHLQKQSDAESWVDLSYHGENSAEASAGRTAFLAKAEEPQTLGASASDWVGYITHGSDNATAESAERASDVPEGCGVLEHIRLLPVRDKIFTLMRRAQVLRFNEITTQVPGVSIEEIFPHLRQCSRAIDGVWVVKSEYLYDKASRGTSHSMLRRCRDYILLKFRKAEHVSRASIRERFSVSPAVLLEMLDGIAVRASAENGTSPWTFCEPPDMDFIQAYPRVVQLEDEQWAKDAAGFAEVPLRQPVNESSTSRRVSGAHEQTKSTVAPEVWVLESLGPAIDAEGNDLSLEQSLQTMCRKALQQFGVCCISLFEKVIALKRSETPTEPVWQNDIRDDDIKAALGAVEAREIRVATEDGQPQTAYVFNTSRGRPDTNLQKYRNTILDLFEQRPRVKRQEILVAWDERGFATLAQSGYLRIMHELAESVSNHWRLKIHT